MVREPDGRGSSFVWIVGLWILAVVFFWPVLAGHESLWFRDTQMDDYPIAAITAASWRAGQIPLWEPRTGFGYPYAATPITGVFYPLTLLLVALPFPRAFNVFTVAHVVLAGTFFFLLLRRWRLSNQAAALGGAVLMFSGFVVTITGQTSFLRGMTWAPLALLAFDGYLAGKGRAHWIATALVLAVEGSGTDPQFVLFTIVLLVLLPFLRPLPLRTSGRSTLLGLVLALGLAGLILGIQYLPLAELIANSDRTAGMNEIERTQFNVMAAHLINLVLPMSFPTMSDVGYFLSFPRGLQLMYTDLYLGVIVLALVMTSLGWLARSDPSPSDVNEELCFGRTALFAFLVAGMAIVLSLGNQTPIEGWLAKIIWPLRSFRYPGKYFWFAGLSLPILAALGFQGLCERRATCLKPFASTLSVVLCSSLLAIVALLSSDLFGPWMFLGKELSFLVFGRRLMSLLRDRWVANLWWVIVYSAALLVLLALWKRGSIRTSIFLGVVGVWAVGDLATSTHWSYPRIDDRFWTTPPKIVGSVEPKRGRVKIATDMSPRFATHALKFIFHVPWETAQDSYISEREILRGFASALEDWNGQAYSLSVRLARHSRIMDILYPSPTKTLSRLLAAVGTEYFLGIKSSALSLIGPLVAREGNIVLHRCVGASPRAYIALKSVRVSSGTTLPTADALLALPREAPFRVLTPGIETDKVLAPRSVRRCTIQKYGPCGLRVDFDLEGKGLLVVLDELYPGWKAFVDGKERPIHLVAGAFRGVEVAQGEHTLEMRFVPLSFRVGLFVTVLGLTLAVVGLLATRSNSRG